MRLRPLSEAECYARCYGGRREEAVNFVRLLARSEHRAPVTGERLRALLDTGLPVNNSEKEAA